MKSKLLLAALIIALLVQAMGCAPAAMPTPAPPPPVEQFVVAGTPVPAPAVVEEEVKSRVGVAVPPAEERLIVKTGNISLLVENTEEVLAHLEALATALGGYVSDSRSSRVNEELYATITLRVPAESFDEARSRIKEEGIELQGEEISARDVTEEYTDLEAHLTNLQAAEEELRELLHTVREKMEKAEDILAVYRQLTEIRGQIEQIQGRMQYLEHAVAMATLTVSLTPKEEVQVVEPGWDWLRTLRESLRDLVRALQFLADIATRFIITLLPILIIVALPFAVLGWLVWLWRRRRAKKEK